MNKDPKDGLDGYDDAEASGEAAAARDEDLEAKEGEEEEEEDSFLPVGLAIFFILGLYCSCVTHPASILFSHSYDP